MPWKHVDLDVKCWYSGVASGSLADFDIDFQDLREKLRSEIGDVKLRFQSSYQEIRLIATPGMVFGVGSSHRWPGLMRYRINYWPVEK